MNEDSLSDYALNLTDEVSASETYWTDGELSDDYEYYYMVVAVGDAGEQSSTYTIGVKSYEFSHGYTLFSMELEPKSDTGIAWYTSEMFSLDTNTLYYYDKANGGWQGHPKFLPENINNVNVDIGTAYIVYIHAEDVSYTFTGI